MQFHQPLCARAGERVQSIDILRHHHQDLARFFQRDDRVMNSVRPRISKPIPTFQLVIPMLDPRRFRSEKILEVNRLPFFPDTLRPAKIRDAAAGRNPSAGEDERFSRGTQSRHQIESSGRTHWVTKKGLRLLVDLG